MGAARLARELTHCVQVLRADSNASQEQRRLLESVLCEHLRNAAPLSWAWEFLESSNPSRRLDAMILAQLAIRFRTLLSAEITRRLTQAVRSATSEGAQADQLEHLLRQAQLSAAQIPDVDAHLAAVDELIRLMPAAPSPSSTPIGNTADRPVRPHP